MNDTIMPVNNEITTEFVPPKAPFPWRRYFARSLDLGLASTIFSLITILIFKTDPSDWGLISNIISIYFPNLDMNRGSKRNMMIQGK